MRICMEGFLFFCKALQTSPSETIDPKGYHQLMAIMSSLPDSAGGMRIAAASCHSGIAAFAAPCKEGTSLGGKAVYSCGRMTRPFDKAKCTVDMRSPLKGRLQGNSNFQITVDVTEGC